MNGQNTGSQQKLGFLKGWKIHFPAAGPQEIVNFLNSIFVKPIKKIFLKDVFFLLILKNNFQNFPFSLL
jgi:hypothetical protein